MNLLRNKSNCKHRQRGLTLVELMVALTISVVLLGGVLKVFANSKQTYRVQEALSRLQENGRFAIEFLARDIRSADFWGCVTSSTSLTNNLDPDNPRYIDYVTGGGVVGTDGATDTITLRGATGSGLVVLPPYGPQASANLFVTAGNDLQQGDIVLVSDCVTGDVFQISNANPGTSGTVVHNTGTSTLPSNYNPGTCGGGANAHCLSQVYAGDAEMYLSRETIYFIANGASGAPALFRNRDQSGAVELVEGVENMQILYGEDTNGDGAADAYNTATAVGANMANVVSVRMALTLRSLEDNVVLQGGADNRLRRNFTTTIAIRNRLP
ncbi:MAG: PilW family protein [Gammaproteobacteria bacterium]